MNQEITISKSIIQFLYESYSSFNRRVNIEQFFSVIEENYFVTDKHLDHAKDFDREINKLPESHFRLTLQLLLKELNDHNKYRKYEAGNINNDYELAEYSKDKIFYSPKLTKEVIEVLARDYKTVEFHTSETFLKPRHNQRLKNCPTRIVLEDQEKYDLFHIIEPFLRNAEYIKILDPYLPNPVALKNLCNLLHKFPKRIRIKLLTKGEREYCCGQSERMKSYADLIELVKCFNDSGYKIEIVYRKIRGHVERYIATDSFLITIPGGLDFLTPDGFYESNINDNECSSNILIDKKED